MAKQQKETNNFLSRVMNNYRKRLMFTLHAVNQMNLPERLISKAEVKEVIEQKDIIEYYSDDPRGASCLMWGKTSQNRIIHVLCAPKRGYLLIITAYVPYPVEWKNNLKVRR